MSALGIIGLQAGEDVKVRETFDSENELAAEQQRQGWQAILNRFASHVAAEQGDAPADAPHRS